MEEPFAQHAWQTVMVGHIWVAVMMSIRSSTRLPTATSRLCRAQTRCAPHLSTHSLGSVQTAPRALPFEPEACKTTKQPSPGCGMMH